MCIPLDLQFLTVIPGLTDLEILLFYSKTFVVRGATEPGLKTNN